MYTLLSLLRGKISCRKVKKKKRSLKPSVRLCKPVKRWVGGLYKYNSLTKTFSSLIKKYKIKSVY